jgi:exodeoxyribonuclease III
VRVITANVNGVRAASRHGGLEWLRAAEADVICLQEVRASDVILRANLEDAGLGGFHVAARASSVRAGHAGVAVLTRAVPTRVSGCFAGCRPEASGVQGPDECPDEFCNQGRWVAVEFPDEAGGTVLAASAYVHTGTADTPAQAEKERFLAAVSGWLGAHRSASALLCGDLNVAHREVDIKNWRGNRGKSGFLESERAYLDAWFAGEEDGGLGWVDLGRVFGGPGPGPYTWWSVRGKAFDTDTGWRIDVAAASPRLAAQATRVTIGRAESYADRWSDHAPVVVDFDLGKQRLPEPN